MAGDCTLFVMSPARAMSLKERTNRIVQGQRVIALPPVIAYPSILLDDQVVHAKMFEARCDLQANVPATNDEHLRVLLGELELQRAPPHPVTLVHARVAVCRSKLREAVEPVEVGRYCDRAPSVVRAVHKSREAKAARDTGLKRELHEDPREVWERLLVRRARKRDIAEARGCKAVVEKFGDAVAAVEGTQVPRQREHVAPPWVRMQARHNP